MITRQSFMDSTKGQWNEVRQWQGLNIGVCWWHENRQWKIVETTDFEVMKSRDYKDTVNFHTREQLWSYIKKNLLQSLPA